MYTSPYAIRRTGKGVILSAAPRGRCPRSRVAQDFADNTGLDGFHLDVIAGTVCGLLGPNGADKTTAVRILTTLLRPDSGQAQVAGFDVVREPRQVQYRVGLVCQNASLDEVLSGRESPVMFGRLLHLSGAAARGRAEELLEQFNLTAAASRSVADSTFTPRRT